MSVLPDSGIGYMLIQYPNAGLNLTTAKCAAGPAQASNCVRNGATVQVFLPGQTEAAAYTFTVNNTGSNPSTPFGVQVFQGADQPTFSNLGRTFFENLNYLYDPINGFVGYQPAGTAGTTATMIPMLALQGNLTLPNGFLSSFTTFLMSDLTLQQTGSGTLGGPITGPGGLTLQSGNVTLGGASSYAGGTVVNGGMLTLGNNGSIVGNVTVNGGGLTNSGTIGGDGLLTVNSGGSFVNNGTVNTPSQWQVNQGTFTNNNVFNGSLANTGTATNNGTLDRLGDQHAAPARSANNGTDRRQRRQHGHAERHRHDRRQPRPQRHGRARQLDRHDDRQRQLRAVRGRRFPAEVAGAGLSDRINVGGTANLAGGGRERACPA